MRENPDYFIRGYNPILYDITEDMDTAQLWKDRNRLNREIENDMELINKKRKAVIVLEHELELRGEIQLEHR
jgi:hypothetical protein